jgi:hypothetical protein
MDPMLLKFGAAVLGKIRRVAANLRFASWERSEVGVRPSQQQDFCLRDLQGIVAGSGTRPLKLRSKMLESPNSTILGAAGEHFVMSQLLRRNVTAALAPTGVPNADIVVTDKRVPAKKVRGELYSI